MAQEGFDKLMRLVDSRYRLSMIVARRAAQLKTGVQPTLTADEYPQTRNTVTISMHEIIAGRGVRWGEDLPTVDEIRTILERERREEAAANYSVSRQAEPGDEE